MLYFTGHFTNSLGFATILSTKKGSYDANVTNA